ncbi:GH25 family lysozyme [Lentilactobacillus hilgardii]|uniref:Glycosyl hydrolase family 25 n=5 Tax=Lactobacillaceae TaxID=33958 RepID=C0XGU8_LENH9|nr:GH25 family lysozyme [Lentilactobacillus hilgardii]EEI25419.1 glycosyl hydrolase family 25 [Lentilactobacillus hilgardii DSM 20176 = ATCC 8290]KRK56868.1 lysozyme M1 (1,4-beta-N-acetylmuramidase) [Lentilactobacillus hilgardii DSM 20176 = ATCC 8290]MCP9334464.1 autolysin [Lentilactobacillus hilgardii]MCP9351061.1 autolysin [Lentilactobacillus hilgardii]MCP9353901.1 autolysin [Lentilactobacillus hilgardii]
MPKLVVDVSGYQASTETYFKNLKANGIDSAMVKLTESTTYVNPNAGNQIANAYQVFGTVGAYHFFHGNGLAEAKYFLAWVKKYGLDKSTVLAIDVEAQDLPANTTPQVNIFLKYLKSQGYPNVITYGSGSWFKYGRINRVALVDQRIWVAAYGVNQPGIDNANAWQYTDNFKGLHVDASYDFDGSLSGTLTNPITQTQPSYYQATTLGLYEVIVPQVNVYKKLKFDKTNKSDISYAKGSRVWASAVKVGKITHLKLKYANGYITSNSAYVKRIRLSGGDQK